MEHVSRTSENSAFFPRLTQVRNSVLVRPALNDARVSHRCDILPCLHRPSSEMRLASFLKSADDGVMEWRVLVLRLLYAISALLLGDDTCSSSGLLPIRSRRRIQEQALS